MLTADVPTIMLNIKLFFLKVSHLRARFQHSIAPGGLAGDRRGVVPASGFSFSSQQFWKIIKENKEEKNNCSQQSTCS